MNSNNPRVIVGAEGTALPPSVRDEMFVAIRDLGYEPELGDIIEYRGEVPLQILLWLRDEIAGPVAIGLATGVGRWLLKRIGRGRAQARVRVIYGPDKKVLAEVPIDDKLAED